MFIAGSNSVQRKSKPLIERVDQFDEEVAGRHDDAVRRQAGPPDFTSGRVDFVRLRVMPEQPKPQKTAEDRAHRHGRVLYWPLRHRQERSPVAVSS